MAQAEKKHMTIDQIKTALTELVGWMNAVKAFKKREEFVDGLKKMAATVASGNDHVASGIGYKTLIAGRNFFGGFLVSCVIDRQTNEPAFTNPVIDGGTEAPKAVRKSWFTNQLDRLRGEKYDPEVIAPVEAAIAAFKAAVEADRGPDFGDRVAKYNAAIAAITAADAEQERLDKVRAQKRRAKKVTVEPAADTREAVLAKRRQAADEIRALIG